MDYIYYAVDYSNSLSHHGIVGQHWYQRRFQNPDGSWTSEGLKRRRKGIGQKLSEHSIKATKRAASKADKKFEDYSDKALEYGNQSQRHKADMTAAEAKYRQAELDKKKHENSLWSKTVGVDTYKLKKFNKTMNDAMNEYDEAKAKKLASDAKLQEYTLKAMDANDEWMRLENKAQKQIDKYIKKYGEEPFSNVDKSNNKTRTNESKASKPATWDDVTKSEKERDDAYDKLEAYRQKNNSFWPDEDGPIYKSRSDFEKGIIDKEGTKLVNDYEELEKKYSKAFDSYLDN